MPIVEGEDFYVGWEPTNRCRVYTMLFHAFVFMQVFNEINSRKLGEKEYNVF